MPQLKMNNVNLMIVSALVILASALGLFVPDFYAARDNAMTTYEIAGQDAISLVCGILLFVLVLLPKKGTMFAVIATGLLVYTTYIYAYFLFGLLVTPLFAVYLVITGLSFYYAPRGADRSGRQRGRTGDHPAKMGERLPDLYCCPGRNH